MNRSKLAVKNGFFSLLCHVVTVVISFVTRSVFIKYLGVEMLGIGSTFSSVLSTLSLAELGFQSAIVYLLYRPLLENDTDRINDIITVLKRVYFVIGCFFIVGSLLFLPFLRYLLKGIEATRYIRLIFLIQAASTASTYFLAYRKTLLYADQKSYVTNLISTISNIVFSASKIVLVIATGNYVFFVVVALVQNVVDNVITHIYDRKIHPFVRVVSFKKSVLYETWNKVKDVFVGKVAGFIYSSTDSLIISSFIGTVKVGFAANYTTVVTALKVLSESVLVPVSPLIGNLLADKKDENGNEQILRIYTYVRFLIAGVTVIPMIVLIQSFIEVWIGAEYRLGMAVAILYGIDLYIHFVHSALCEFIQGRGLFKEDKKIELIGATVNIVLSLILVFPFGIEGVLIGTVVSQCFFWMGRSRVVYKYCFPAVKDGLKKYWCQQISYIVSFSIILVVLIQIYALINMHNLWVRFIIGGVICEVLFLTVEWIVFRKSPEQKALRQILKSMLRR